MSKTQRRYTVRYSRQGPWENRQITLWATSAEKVEAEVRKAWPNAYIVSVDDVGCWCDACMRDGYHDSGCAVHNEPAFPNGPCSCQLGVWL